MLFRDKEHEILGFTFGEEEYNELWRTIANGIDTMYAVSGRRIYKLNVIDNDDDDAVIYAEPYFYKADGHSLYWKNGVAIGTYSEIAELLEIEF